MTLAELREALRRKLQADPVARAAWEQVYPNLEPAEVIVDTRQPEPDLAALDAALAADRAQVVGELAATRGPVGPYDEEFWAKPSPALQSLTVLINQTGQQLNDLRQAGRSPEATARVEDELRRLVQKRRELIVQESQRPMVSRFRVTREAMEDAAKNPGQATREALARELEAFKLQEAYGPVRMPDGTVESKRRFLQNLASVRGRQWMDLRGIDFDEPDNASSPPAAAAPAPTVPDGSRRYFDE